jgi:hypothetical protein
MQRELPVTTRRIILKEKSMKLYKTSSLARMFLLVVLTCMLGACGTSQNTGTSGTPTVTREAT